MESIAIQLLRNFLRRAPNIIEVDTQAAKVNGAGQQGEGRVVERFMGSGEAPALEGDVSNGGAILGAYIG